MHSVSSRPPQLASTLQDQRAKYTARCAAIFVAIGVGLGAEVSRAQPPAPIAESAFATAGWEGAAFRDPTSGQFGFCRQGRAFDDGTVLTFSLDEIGHLDIGLVGGAWTADPNATLQTAARLDDIGPVALNGSVDDAGALVLSLNNDPAILAAFRGGYVFEIVGDAFGPLLFELSGTAASLSDLRTCAITYREVPAASAAELSSDRPAATGDGALTIEDLGRVQAAMVAPDSDAERQSFDRLLLTGLAERLTGGLGLTIDDTTVQMVDIASPDARPANPIVPPPRSRAYRIGDQGGFGSDGLYGTPYTIRPPSSPYSISTPGTANPDRR
ncbi:MAG: hypothetical protein AAFX92_07370 [Pseudomonadota bacterium]